MPKRDFYDFLDGEIDYSEVEITPDDTDKEKTLLMKVVAVTRTPGGRIARFWLDLKNPKPRSIEITISEPLARAIAKLFDEPQEAEPQEEGGGDADKPDAAPEGSG